MVGMETLYQWLTHWGRDKMDAISQTTFSSAFSWIKMFEFRQKFHWSLFLRVKLTMFHHCLRWWLGAGQATSHYLKQWWLVYWRIYASLGLNELSARCGSFSALALQITQVMQSHGYGRCLTFLSSLVSVITHCLTGTRPFTWTTNDPSLMGVLKDKKFNIVPENWNVWHFLLASVCQAFPSSSISDCNWPVMCINATCCWLPSFASHYHSQTLSGM